MCQVAPAAVGDLSRKRKYGKERQLSSSESHNPRIPFHNDEHLPLSSPDQHHEMSRDTHHKLDLPTWLGDLSDDPALEVRVNKHSAKITDLIQQHLRILFHGSKSIYLDVCLDMISMVMSIASQQRNATILFLQTTEFTSTRSFASTIQHMISDVHKTLLTHGLMLTS